MRVTKDGKYIVVERDDGKVIKYDLQLRQTIGIRGHVVQGVSSQLKEYTVRNIIDACEDENYKAFLEYVVKQSPCPSVRTFFNNIPKFHRKEGFFAAGLRNFTQDFTTSVSNIPKSMLNFCRKHSEVLITYNLYYVWKQYPDMMRNITSQEYLYLTYDKVCRIASDGGVRIIGRDAPYYGNHFLTLVETYGYNAVALMRYIDALANFEALEHGIVREIYDYVEMASKMSVSYDKYPRNFLTVHRIMSRNYNRFKQVVNENEFKQRIDLGLEWSKLGYKIIYPKSTQDIKDEGAHMHNCVASYIDGVLSGYRHIVFLRMEAEPEKSLVTVEIRDYKIVQAKERHNQQVSAERANVLRLYQNYLNKLKEERKHDNDGNED